MPNENLMTNIVLTGVELDLKKKTLKKVTSDDSGWTTYYIDENSGRWVEEYPNSEFHGGGLPQLRLIEKFPWENSPNYKKDFLLVRKVINDFDPCSFIKGGGPLDEYDGLSNTILSFAYNKKPISVVVQNIYKEIKNSYGLDVRENQVNSFQIEIEEMLIKALAALKHSS